MSTLPVSPTPRNDVLRFTELFRRVGVLANALDELMKRVEEIENTINEMDVPGMCHVCHKRYPVDSAEVNLINLNGLCPGCAEAKPKCKNCQQRFPEDEITDGLCPDCHQDLVAPERPGSRVNE